MRFTCNHCGDLLGNCDCDLQIAAEERAAELVCETCTNDAPFECWDSCLKCLAAGLIHDDPKFLADMRKRFTGAPFMAVIEKEIARQIEALRTLEVA